MQEEMGEFKVMFAGDSSQTAAAGLKAGGLSMESWSWTFDLAGVGAELLLLQQFVMKYANASSAESINGTAICGS